MSARMTGRTTLVIAGHYFIFRHADLILLMGRARD